jgi:hypothetical protein
MICDTCLFFRTFPKVKDAKCTRYPPTLDKSGEANYPPVKPTNPSCGEYVEWIPNTHGGRK